MSIQSASAVTLALIIISLFLMFSMTVQNFTKGIEESVSISEKERKDDKFDVFWKAYPRKIGKGDARKAFAKVKVPVETLLSAIEQQTRSEQWTRENGRFIPNPATWLNQGRWEDELAAPESKYHSKPGYGVQRHGDKLTDLERQAIARMMEDDP